MVVAKYIKQLLDERKRVILPGFGNLEVKEHVGSVPSSGGRIDPPGLRVWFDTGYSKDDGMLASIAASGEEFDEEEAGQLVLELVDAIKFALDKGESYEIPDTGSFIREDDGKIHFKADNRWVIEPDQFGLESMDLLELEEQPSKEEQPAREDKAPPVEKAPKEPTVGQARTEPKQTPPVKPVLKTSTPLTELHQPVKKKRHVNRWRVIWIVTSLLVVILVALILIPVDNIRKPKPKDPTVTGTPATEVPADDGSSNTPDENQTSTENQATESSDSGEPPATDDPDRVALDHNFFIIAGSFKHLKNASDLQDQLMARGYPAEVMVAENRMYRVSVSSYATKNEAERAMTGVKAEPGLESCWLLSN